MAAGASLLVLLGRFGGMDGSGSEQEKEASGGHESASVREDTIATPKRAIDTHATITRRLPRSGPRVPATSSQAVAILDTASSSSSSRRV